MRPTSAIWCGRPRAGVSVQPGLSVNMVLVAGTLDDPRLPDDKGRVQAGTMVICGAGANSSATRPSCDEPWLRVGPPAALIPVSW